jgi:hypothetical protein
MPYTKKDLGDIIKAGYKSQKEADQDMSKTG